MFDLQCIQRLTYTVESPEQERRQLHCSLGAVVAPSCFLLASRRGQMVESNPSVGRLKGLTVLFGVSDVSAQLRSPLPSTVNGISLCQGTRMLFLKGFLQGQCQATVFQQRMIEWSAFYWQAQICQHVVGQLLIITNTLRCPHRPSRACSVCGSKASNRAGVAIHRCESWSQVKPSDAVALREARTDSGVGHVGESCLRPAGPACWRWNKVD